MSGAYNGDALAADLQYLKLLKLAQQASDNNISQLAPLMSRAITAEVLSAVATLGPASVSVALPDWSEHGSGVDATLARGAQGGDAVAASELGFGERNRLSTLIASDGGRPGPTAFVEQGAQRPSSHGVWPTGLSDVSGVIASPPTIPSDNGMDDIGVANVGLLDLAQAAERLSATFTSMRLLDRTTTRASPFVSSPAITATSERPTFSPGRAVGGESTTQLSRAIQNLSVLETKADADLKFLQPIDGRLSNLLNETAPSILSAINANGRILIEIEKNTHQDLIDKINKIGDAVVTWATIGGVGWKVYRGYRAGRAARAAGENGGLEEAAELAPGEVAADVAVESAPAAAEAVTGGELAGFAGLELGLDATGIGLPVGAALAVGAGGWWALNKFRELNPKQKAYDRFTQAYHNGSGSLAGLSDQQLADASGKIKDDVDRLDQKITHLNQGKLAIRPGSDWETYLADHDYQARAINDEVRRRQTVAAAARSPQTGAGAGLSSSPSDIAISAGLANLPVKSVKAIGTAFGQLGQAIGHTGHLIQDIVPQLLSESIALKDETSALTGPKGFTAAVRAAAVALQGLSRSQAHVPAGCCCAPTQITTTVTLDGRTIATAVSKYQAHSISGPRGSHLRPDAGYGLKPVGAPY